uniref:Uncharacterized protein n=1 Tax=Heterorhabditis bacteriophora TaxID=37862 RepID=A0A1I7WZH5_HETBA
MFGYSCDNKDGNILIFIMFIYIL